MTLYFRQDIIDEHYGILRPCKIIYSKDISFVAVLAARSDWKASVDARPNLSSAQSRKCSLLHSLWFLMQHTFCYCLFWWAIYLLLRFFQRIYPHIFIYFTGIANNHKNKKVIYTFGWLFWYCSSIYSGGNEIPSSGWGSSSSHNFCHVPLESHFGRHRGLARRNDNPTLLWFVWINIIKTAIQLHCSQQLKIRFIHLKTINNSLWN